MNKNFKVLYLCALILVFGAWATTASAFTITIDFESLLSANNSINTVTSPYKEDGFSITDSELRSWGTLHQNFASSTGLFSLIGTTTIELTDDGSTPFDMVSIDLSKVVDNGVTPSSILFTGILSGGGTVTQSLTPSSTFGFQTFTFDSSFKSLSSLSWMQGSGGPNSDGHQFDNIVINSVVADTVPEPTSMLLVGFGLIGLAGFRRRLTKS